MDLFIVMLSKKKNLLNIDALVQIQKIEAEALQLVESLIPVLCFLTIAPGHVIHVICVFIYLSTWNCNDAVDDRSQGELGGGLARDMEELSCLLTLVNAWYTAQGPETGEDSSIMQQQERVLKRFCV